MKTELTTDERQEIIIAVEHVELQLRKKLHTLCRVGKEYDELKEMANCLFFGISRIKARQNERKAVEDNIVKLFMEVLEENK